MPNINSVEKKSEPLPPLHPLEASGGFMDEPEDMNDYENSHTKKNASPTHQQERTSPESYHTANNINYYADIKEKTLITENNNNNDVIAKLDETIDNLMQTRTINYN